MNSHYNLLPYNALQYDQTTAIEITISHALNGVDGAITKHLLTQKVDSLVETDVVTKAITNKVLTDGLRINGWFTVKQAPQSDPWS